MTTFGVFSERLDGELEERIGLAKRALAYHNGYLDDCLRAILPHDLILITAPTGEGKSDIALSIAASNAALGKRVHYFALEAEPRELERRTKFAMLSKAAYGSGHPQRQDLNYTDWMLGRCEHVCADFNAKIDRELAEQLDTMATYYRGSHFDYKTLQEQIIRIHERTELIVVDHLHYIDSDNENEQRALGDTVKAIRDIALTVGRPVILVAHQRKRDHRQIVACTEDVHGSSNVTKICTQIIAMDRAYSIESTKWFLSPTFMRVLKDRRDGMTGLVALTMFDRRTKGYRAEYTLGRMKKGNSEWEAIAMGDKPSWAVRHRELES